MVYVHDRIVEERRYPSAAAYASAPAAPQEKSVYRYDALGRTWQVTEYANSNLTTPSRPATTTLYDPVTGSVASVASPEGTIRYEYQPATGRPARTWSGANPGLPDTDTRYDYDAQGRLWHVTAASLPGSPVTTYGYDAVGNLKTVALANGVTTAYTYDALNRLDLERVTRDDLATPTVVEAALLTEYDYAVLSDGKRDSVTETVSAAAGGDGVPVLTDWAYDALGRLTAETVGGAGGYTDAYTLDLVGNRVEKIHDAAGSADDVLTESSFNANDQLTGGVSAGAGAGTTAYVYDANGSTTLRTVTPAGGTAIATKYVWDLRNRMAGLDANNDGDLADAGDASYAYDADGTRVGRSAVQAGGGTDATAFLVDPINPTGYSQILREVTTGVHPSVTAYVVGQDVVGQMKDGAVRYLGYDGHGSTRFLTTEAGAVATPHWRYDAFGGAINFDPSAAGTTLLYSGEQWDRTFQQYPLRARIYDSSAGRFWTFDTYEGDLSHPESLEKYLYGRSNPVKYIDPSGHFVGFTELGTASATRVSLGTTLVTILKPVAQLAAVVGLLDLPFTDIQDEPKPRRPPTDPYPPDSPDRTRLYKAPAKDYEFNGDRIPRDPASEVKIVWNATILEDQNGWGSGGIFFSLIRSVAEGYQRHFRNGLQILSFPRVEFLQLGGSGVLVPDSLEKASFRVPIAKISIFNQYVVRNAPFNFYIPEGPTGY